MWQKDSSHNVTKATRKVTYSASDEDTSGGAEPQAEEQPEAADQTQEGAENGDTAQGQAAETDAAAQTPEELEQQAQAQRDAAIAALSPGAPRFYLKQHYVTISAGKSSTSFPGWRTLRMTRMTDPVCSVTSAWKAM